MFHGFCGSCNDRQASTKPGLVPFSGRHVYFVLGCQPHEPDPQRPLARHVDAPHRAQHALYCGPHPWLHDAGCASPLEQALAIAARSPICSLGTNSEAAWPPASTPPCHPTLRTRGANCGVPPTHQHSRRGVLQTSSHASGGAQARVPQNGHGDGTPQQLRSPHAFSSTFCHGEAQQHGGCICIASRVGG